MTVSTCQRRATSRARTRSALLAVAGLAAMTAGAQAAENGSGFYLLGNRGPMAGIMPGPGLYFENDVYSYDAKLDAQTSLPSGGRVFANVRS